MTNEAILRRIMLDFAERTGLTSGVRPPIRYLWTDAFAVCNFLGLFVEHADEQALQLALRLVEQTHHVLGRHRQDDVRQGWLSALPDAEGPIHPTRGGLRIGKRLPERTRGEPEDPALEWDRDGQYFHYLTRWMHALDRVACVTGEPAYHRWACELAQAAHAGFVHVTPSGTRQLFWKMSIDLSCPQVASMGLHDPLDGFLTFSQLQATCAEDAGLDLRREIRELAGLCAGRCWDTDDSLGIGGLLCDASRLAQLMANGVLDEPALLEDLLASSLRGVASLARRGAFEGRPEQRLGFRELGLSIGLHGAERMRHLDAETLGKEPRALLYELARYQPLASHIESCWLAPQAQECSSWRDHLDINTVMLATSLAPRGYLDLGGRAPSAAALAATPPSSTD